MDLFKQMITSSAGPACLDRPHKRVIELKLEDNKITFKVNWSKHYSCALAFNYLLFRKLALMCLTALTDRSSTR